MGTVATLAEYWYNTTYHPALNATPFEVLYGYPPNHFGIAPADACQVQDLKQWLQERTAMTNLIQSNLTRAQNIMKLQKDKHRQERQFQVGDWVYVKLQPHIQQSVHRRVNHKLSYKYFGPYLILQRIGAVAYKLQLPATSKIHPVIHVSQLKQALPPDVEVQRDDQLQLLTLDTAASPIQVLRTRYCQVGNSVIPFALTQWEYSPQSRATWENVNTLHHWVTPR